MSEQEPESTTIRYTVNVKRGLKVLTEKLEGFEWEAMSSKDMANLSKALDWIAQETKGVS
jgi:hypothetical protein